MSCGSTCEAADATGLSLASTSASLLNAGSSGSLKRIVTAEGAATSVSGAGSRDVGVAWAKAVDAKASDTPHAASQRSVKRENKEKVIGWR
ncbi:hypothetical protein PPGU16_04650 [Paraburkholderia largidicola]|uniref:Uncharacterized protein n=1 Tax=Paraburkholderia largidicola TaxID=3014751 RepID=A0A7I8BG48_9BURK|nr:hypothetical protein PPGU16_04650 [Paraburkholderia sp. PGU16]